MSGQIEIVRDDGFRIRVGDYRVVYSADPRTRKIVVAVIRHRREVYRD